MCHLWIDLGFGAYAVYDYHRLYTKAVEQKPDFDIALANLGNAIKDIVRGSAVLCSLSRLSANVSVFEGPAMGCC